MRFIGFPDDMPKEMLDELTNEVIEHCKAIHCTCDPSVHMQVIGLVVTDELQEVHGIVVGHSAQCYGTGRKN